MDIPDELPRVSLELRLGFRTLGGAGVGGFVVEAVEVAAGILEFLDPFFGLRRRWWLDSSKI